MSEARRTCRSSWEHVQQGASVLITRHCVPVARLVPADRTTNAASAVAAVRAARTGVTLTSDLRAMRDEGRR